MQVQRSPSIRQIRATMAAAAFTTTEQVTWEVVNGSHSSLSNVLQRATPAIVNGFDRRNHRGWTALQLAVYYDKSYNTVNSLLQAGADPNIGGPAGQLPLYIAIAKGRDYHIVSVLLSRGANPNIVGPNGKSLLYIAIERNRDYHILSSLLSRGANPSVVGPDGKSLLYMAIEKDRDYHIVGSLLSRGANPNIAGPNGKSLLYMAIDKGLDYYMVSSLLSRGANPNIAGPDGRFPLHIAITKNRDYYMVSSLLLRGANANVQDRKGKTPLLNLLQLKNIDPSSEAALLMEARGFDPNVSDGKGMTALHYLAHYGIFRENDTENNGEDNDRFLVRDPRLRELNRQLREQTRELNRQMREQTRELQQRQRQLERRVLRQMRQQQALGDDESSSEVDEDDGDATILSALIRKGANVNTTDIYGRTPLYFAAKAGHLEILVGLLQSGADPNYGTKLHPLRIAVSKGHIEIVEALLQGGSKVTVTEGLNNDTCLHLAARGGKDRIVGLLLHTGADPNATNQHYQTPLHSAIEAGCLSSVEAIISAGANVNAADRNHGNTPLHWAATLAAGNKISILAILDVLFQSGADAHKRNNFGRTPLMEAAVADVDLNILYFFLEKDPTQVIVTTHAPNSPPIVPERQLSLVEPTRRSRRLRGEDPES